MTLNNTQIASYLKPAAASMKRKIAGESNVNIRTILNQDYQELLNYIVLIETGQIDLEQIAKKHK